MTATFAFSGPKAGVSASFSRAAWLSMTLTANCSCCRASCCACSFWLGSSQNSENKAR
uniref:Uncharacterized protein n=1 Tax=Leclercia adecarboxylata TaxID=83655 RepID=A0A7D5JZB4_9ENTR|nr:hypothetical protein [Leclercia adecarboxylata]UNJ80337.1 hypothetical protein [Leclercia sp.]